MRKKNRIKIFKDRAQVYDKKNRLFIIDKSDVPFASTKTWYVNTQLRPFNRENLFYRLILGAKKGEVVDHIDRNTLNNRRSNLRLCTKQQNAYNSKRRSDNTTSIKGVTLWKRPGRKPLYMVQFKAGDRKFCSCHSSKDEAKKAYAKFAQAHAKEFFYEG